MKVGVLALQGDFDAHRRRLDTADFAKEIEPGHLRHALVGQHDSDIARLREIERGAGAGKRARVVGGLEHVLQYATDGRVIVDDEHQWARLGHRRV